MKITEREAAIRIDMASQWKLGRVKKDRMDYGIELMDVIHSAETALRMEFTDQEIAQLQDSVIEKNRARGYYG